MKKIIILFLFVTILVLTSCAKLNDNFYQIKDYEAVGIIKDYNKNDDIDLLKEKMLKKQLANINSDAVFANVEILGEANGKTYVLAIYRGYKKDNNKINCTFSNEELAEFDNISDNNYNSISGQETYLKMNDFLPASIIEEKKLETTAGMFDWYVYSIGKVDEELQQEAEEYFNK